MGADKRTLEYNTYEVREGTNQAIQFILYDLDRDTLVSTVHSLTGRYVRLSIESGRSLFTVISALAGETQFGQLEIGAGEGSGEITFTAGDPSFWVKEDNPYLFWIEVSTNSAFDTAVLLDWPEGERGQIVVI